MVALRRLLYDGRSTMVSLMVALRRLLYNGRSNRFSQSPSPLHHSLSIPSPTSESKLINGRYLYIDTTSFKPNTSSIFMVALRWSLHNGGSTTVALQRLLYDGCSTTFDLRRFLYDGCSTTVVLG